jgi:8-amino-3,8-dideoxy-alpha-D-manno-octulosonate transaminase
MTTASHALALNGGSPAARESFPSGWHGPAEIGEEEVEAVAGVVRSRRLFRFLDHQHSWCSRLEEQFRAMTGCAHALAVGGGTGSLICGLVGIGIGEGDEVIVPGYTYVASAMAVLICGAVPVIAEIDESLTLDPRDIEAKISPRTRAIMPVHMRGIPCDLEPILELARKHDLLVLEDCAQACGGSYRGKRLGSYGAAGCFSLQQYKLITAGEGGMVVTQDRQVFDRAALRHDSAMCFWRPGESSVRPFAGENFRMNEMEGALGSVQFGRLEAILARTRAIHRRLHGALAGTSGIRLHQAPDPDGDCGICLPIFLPRPGQAKWFAQALQAEGLPAGSIYDKGIPDRHIYCYWEPVMEKTSEQRTGWPWTSPHHDPSRAYDPKMCPRTLEILERVVAIHISQTYEDRHVEWIIQGVRKVAAAL